MLFGIFNDSLGNSEYAASSNTRKIKQIQIYYDMAVEKPE
jgi:hypothetical protein